MTVEKHLLSTLTLAGYFYVAHQSTEFLCTAHLQHLCTVLCLFLHIMHCITIIPYSSLMKTSQHLHTLHFAFLCKHYKPKKTKIQTKSTLLHP